MTEARRQLNGYHVKDKSGAQALPAEGVDTGKLNLSAYAGARYPACGGVNATQLPGGVHGQFTLEAIFT